MGLTNRVRTAMDTALLATSVALNTGAVPMMHRCMVTIETTSVCNLRCPLCPAGTGTLERERKYITLEDFDRILALAEPFALGYVLNMFGEPTFHPDFSALLERTRLLPTWLSTNLNYGEAAARELAKWGHLHIICSVDTVDPAEYNSYRTGGDYARVLSNLDILSSGNCHVYPQFLTRKDCFDPEAYTAFAHGHGIPVENIIMKERLGYFSLEPTDTPVPGVCHSGYTEIFFNCDGYQIPCCANARRELHMAHVRDLHFPEELYRGETGRRLRRQLARNKNSYPSCGQCPGLNYWRKYPPAYWKAFKNAAFGKRDGGSPHVLSFYE